MVEESFGTTGRWISTPDAFHPSEQKPLSLRKITSQHPAHHASHYSTTPFIVNCMKSSTNTHIGTQYLLIRQRDAVILDNHRDAQHRPSRVACLFKSKPRSYAQSRTDVLVGGKKYFLGARPWQDDWGQGARTPNNENSGVRAWTISLVVWVQC